MRPSVPDVHLTDPQDSEFAAYRALSGQAVFGLIVGLLAPLAMIAPLFWSIPMLGAVINCHALRRISSSASPLVGRKLAIVGLALSLLFLAAAPADWMAYRWIVRNEARQFAAVWFRYLSHDEPHKAYQLSIVPELRQPLDEHLWAHFRNTPQAREELEKYVADSFVRTLLALGQRAQLRFYQDVGQSHDGNNDYVAQQYAITYEDGGEKKSILVTMQMSRLSSDGGADWRITGVEGASGR